MKAAMFVLVFLSAVWLAFTVTTYTVIKWIARGCDDE
jgi:hypothetical protein